jgi:flagellar assembly factor FliW
VRYRTKELGIVEVEKSRVLCFIAPLLGFEAFRKYALLPVPGCKPFFVLQSLEEPQLAFPVVRAEELTLAYRGRACATLVSAGDLQSVAAASPDDVACWIVVALPKDDTPLRLNLRAPLIVNEEKQLAAQVILGEEVATSGKPQDAETGKLGELEIGKLNGGQSRSYPISHSSNRPVTQSPAVSVY